MVNYAEIRKELAKTQKKTKFGAQKQLAKVTLLTNGVKTEEEIRFDSKAEFRYYNAIILPLINAGKLTDVEFHKVYVLQEKFTKNGKKFSAIKYEADFVIKFIDGTETIIDVKGFSTPIFKLKQKLFEYKYPDKKITLAMV